MESAGFRVSGSFHAISELEGNVPDSDFLAVVDYPLPEDQVKAVKQISSLYPSAKAVVLTESFDLTTMIGCFKSGAVGYILKSIKSQPLVTALRLASFGEKVLPSNVVELFNRPNIGFQSEREAQNDIADAGLSVRELDVLHWLTAGESNKAIARNLEVSPATVKVHVKTVLRKLKVQNRTQAALWAKERNIGEGPNWAECNSLHAAESTRSW